MNAAGNMIVKLGDANRFEINPWGSSLDIYLSNLSSRNASELADSLCHRYFHNWDSRSQWNVRVLLADEHVAAQCTIERAHSLKR